MIDIVGYNRRMKDIRSIMDNFKLFVDIFSFFFFIIVLWSISTKSWNNIEPYFIFFALPTISIFLGMNMMTAIILSWKLFRPKIKLYVHKAIKEYCINFLVQYAVSLAIFAISISLFGQNRGREFIFIFSPLVVPELVVFIYFIVWNCKRGEENVPAPTAYTIVKNAWVFTCRYFVIHLVIEALLLVPVLISGSKDFAMKLVFCIGSTMVISFVTMLGQFIAVLLEPSGGEEATSPFDNIKTIVV